jgi:penicillin amidase
MGNPDAEVLMQSLEKPQTVFASDAIARRNQVLLTSLTLAWIDLQRLLGPDPAQWQWGKLHHSLMAHPFASAVDAGERTKLNVGPLPKFGSAHTPNQSSYDPNNFQQTGGPSFRVVIDVGNWDNSHAVNAPGQSGDPDSPHYRDLAPLWLKGEYFPLLYSRKLIEEAAVQRFELLPR